MKLGSSKKRKHILTFFASKSKKFKFYYKIRNFKLLNKRNFFLTNSMQFGLISLKSCYLHLEPLLSCIKFIKRFLKIFLLLKANLYVLIFPDFVLTNKPREVRMGRGKGSPGKKIVLLRKNTLLFTIGPINKIYAKYILFQCKIRLPVPVKNLIKI